MTTLAFNSGATLLYDGDTSQQTGTISDGVNTTGYVIDYAVTGAPYPYYMGDTDPGLAVTSNDSKTTPFAHIKFQDDPSTPTAVDGFTFGIGDVDYAPGSWRDAIRIEAYDANGNPVAITVSGVTHHLFDNGLDGTSGVMEIYGDGDLSLSTGFETTDLAGESDGLTFEFAGPVSEVKIFQYFKDDGFAPDTDLITLEDATFTTIVCFASGTRIETDRGERAVEDLALGDLVRTVDGALRPIRWIGKRDVSMDERAENPGLHPVRIMAGAMGDGLPKRDLVVSRQHRMLVRSRIAARMFGAREVLIPAIKLAEMPGIFIDETVENLAYFHILLDSHDVVLAEGAPSETLFTGPEALKAVAPAARAEILTLFPQIASPDFVVTAVRPIPEKGKLVKKLVERHRTNARQLFEADSRP